MKRIFLAVFLLNFSFANIPFNPQSEVIKEILQITGIDPDQSVQEIVAITQKEWLRTGERVGVKDKEEWNNVKNDLMPLFRSIGLVDTIEPATIHYSSILVFGAKLPVVIKRLESVIKRELSFDTLYLLAGERQLDVDEIEILQEMGLFAKDEREMVESIAARLIPSDIHYKVIKAPKKEGAPRATTADTVEAWYQTEQKSPILLVSSQPYGIYQQIMAASLLPKELHMELLAERSNEKRIVIYLDTLARILFFTCSD